MIVAVVAAVVCAGEVVVVVVVVVGASVVGGGDVVVVVVGTVLGVEVVDVVLDVVSPVGVLFVPPEYRIRAVIPSAVTQMIATMATQALGDSEPPLRLSP